MINDSQGDIDIEEEMKTTMIWEEIKKLNQEYIKTKQDIEDL